MRTIHLLIFSAIFGFFAIIGDQSAYQVEKKIYFLNEKIETLNEELDNNMHIFDFYSLNHKMILYGLNHVYTLKYLKNMQDKININISNLTSQLPKEIKQKQSNLINSFNLFNSDKKSSLSPNKMLDYVLDNSWYFLSLLDDSCLQYSNKKMCADLKKLVADDKKTKGKRPKINEIELNIYNIDFALAAIKNGQRDILKKKTVFIADIKSLTFWRQISLVFSVGGSILSIIFILLYFRRYVMTKKTI